MKLLSLWEPWATLMALDKKRIETRSWCTSYRGWLAIQAAKTWNLDCQRWVCEDAFTGALEPHYGTGHADDGTWLDVMKRSLPRGHIVAVVYLNGCYRTESFIRRSTGRGEYDNNAPILTPEEEPFGDYSPGRYGWTTERCRRLLEPIPFKAKQGLCRVDEGTVNKIREQLVATRAEDEDDRA